MKKYLVLLLMMVLVASTTTMALPPVKVTKCATCGLPIGRCQYKGKHPTKPKKETTKPKAKCHTCGKTIDNCPYGGKHPAPVKNCATCGQPVNNCQYSGTHPKCPTCGKVVDNCQYSGTHPKCPTCGKVVDNCQYGGKHPKCPTCGKVVDNCQYGGKHPKCPTCGKIVENCQYSGTHPSCPTCGKVVDNCQYNGIHPKCHICGKVVDDCEYGGKSPIMTDEQKAVINDLVASMVWVEGCKFTLGATLDQGYDAHWNEKPAHDVTLKGFYISKYEVTQKLWQVVMGNNPSRCSGDSRRPVEQVSWEDCQAFINKLNHMTGMVGKRYRLPTEAEWEYAARGGYKSVYGHKYSGGSEVGSVAWYNRNSRDKTHPVGEKSPNELGLYDMSGNVNEWCQDWYGDYGSGSQTNPTGPSTGSSRVIRGGSCYDDYRLCRVSSRDGVKPTYRIAQIGLRLAASLL